MSETLAEFWASLYTPEFYLKFAIMIALAPFWYPVLKALYREASRGLAPEGGLLGRAPTPREARRLEQEARLRPPSMLSEPRVDVRPARGGAPARRASGSRPPGRARPANAGFARTRRPGF
jgi:hypothetical protein